MIVSDLLIKLRNSVLLGVIATYGVGCGNSDVGEECASVREPLADNAPSTTGFSANEVLAWATGTQHFEGMWSMPPADLSWSAAPEPVQVNVTLSRRAGTAEELTVCGAALSIPVTLQITTSDGSLRETLATELLATSKDAARLRIETTFKKLQGTLEVGSHEKNLHLVQPYVEAQFAPCGASGVFTAFRERRTEDAVADEPMPPMLSFSAPDGCNLPAP